MNILVSIATRHGALVSPLFPRGHKHVSLFIQGPESVQDLRATNCKNYTGPVMKWLSSITLEGTSIVPDRYDELMYDFAINFSDANTYMTIEDAHGVCLEFSAIFSNLPVYQGGRVHDYKSLQDLTKDLTLSEAWSE